MKNISLKVLNCWLFFDTWKSPLPRTITFLAMLAVLETDVGRGNSRHPTYEMETCPRGGDCGSSSPIPDSTSRSLMWPWTKTNTLLFDKMPQINLLHWSLKSTLHSFLKRYVFWSLNYQWLFLPLWGSTGLLLSSLLPLSPSILRVKTEGFLTFSFAVRLSLRLWWITGFS